MNQDAELLRCYVESRSEEAFGELVKRHLSLVYFAALRRTGGNTHLAEDIAQNVFTALARDAASLMRHATLAGWLYTTTRFTAAKAVRTERRRQAREQEAHLMHELSNGSAARNDWEQLRPVIDEALDGLNERDREAVLLRCLEGRAFAEVGATLKISEDAARMRVERALGKLQALLGRRGVTSTAGALAAVLSEQAALAAPAGMAASVTATASVAGAAAGVGGSFVAWIAFMSTSKNTVMVTALVLAVALGGGVFEFRASRDGAAAIAAARRENAKLSTKIAELSRRVAAVADEGTALKRTIAAASSSASPAAGGLPGGAGGGGGFGGRGGGGGLGSEDLNTPEALEAGRAFLAQHPEAQRALESTQREAFERLAAPWFAVLRLSPEEQEALYGEYARIWPRSLRVSGIRASMSADRSQNSREVEPFVRELVGEERFKQFENSLRNDRGGREPDSALLAKVLAGAAHDSDTPLTPDQTAALVEILERHSTQTRSPVLMPNSRVWTTAMPEVAQVLSAGQMATLRLVLDSGVSGAGRF